MASPCVRKKPKAPEYPLPERGWVLLVCPRCEDRTPHRRLVFQVELAGAFGMGLTVPGQRCLRCGTESRPGPRGNRRDPLGWESRIGVGS